MEQLQVTFKVITPLVLSGANQAQAEFRPASLKGAMRFWYRALDPNFREREAEIFGGTGKKDGQAQFLLRYEPGRWKQDVLDKESFNAFNKGSDKHTGNGLDYFAHSLKRARRAYLLPGTEFKIQLLFRKNTTDQIRRAVLGSLWMLGHIGGLGSRSRRGFGTIALQKWELSGNCNWQEIKELPIAHGAQSPQEWVRLFEEGLQVLNKWFGSERKKTHTILDSDCRFLFLDEPCSAGWAYALNLSGQLMQDFRLRKEPDYTEVKQQICAMEPNTAKLNKDVNPAPMKVGPQRAAFGLPLIFRYPSLKGSNEITFEGTRKHQRSGSPVWIRIVEIGNKCYPFFAFMSAPLLPPQEKIFGKLEEGKTPEKGTGKKRNKVYKTVSIARPSGKILTDFQDFITQNAKVLEVDERWQR